MNRRSLALLINLSVVTACTAIAGIPLDKVPGFAIPRLSAPPKIDGTIDPVEWREAVAIAGVVGQADDILLPRPTTFYMGWDAEHFYFACRAYLRPGYKPVINEGRSPGMAYTLDDGLELIFNPQGSNVSADNRRAAFKLFLNCFGYTGDSTRLVDWQQNKNWSPAFQTATRITPAGSAPNGGAWWEMEASASLADFELTGPNKAGDQWRFMWGINHIPAFIQARVPCALGYNLAEGKNVGTLVENTPAVQFTMDSLSNLASDGTAALEVKAFNPVNQAATLAVDINVAGAIVTNATLTVPAAGAAQFNLADKLPAGVTNGEARVRVSLAGKPLLTWTALFNVGKYNWMLKPVEARDPNQFTFSASFNPIRQQLAVKGDSYYLPDPAQARALEYRVIPVGASQPVIVGSVTNVAEFYFQDVVSLPVKPGKYTVEAFLKLADGHKLGPMTAALEKQDEAQAFPVWWGKKFGNIERVLPPFTAIRRTTGQAASGKGPSGAAFACWGREYRLNALGLPDGLRSQGEAVLAGAARIVAVVNGKEEAIKLGAPKITEATDWRIRFEGRAAGAGLEFTAKGWLEQDGLVYVEITYRPQGKQPVRVEALRIEFPLSEMDAESLVCGGPATRFAGVTTIALPKAKVGRLWSTLDSARTGSRMLVGSFYPTVWIGSERRGFLWWADSDRGWFPEDEIPAHEVIRMKCSEVSVQSSEAAPPTEHGTLETEHSCVVLRNNIIGKPVTLSGARTVSLSYMASPFKPLPKGWRTFASAEDGTLVQPFRGARTDSKTGKKVWVSVAESGYVNWIHPESRYPEEWSALWAEQKQEADAHYRQFQYTDPYLARTGLNFGHMSLRLNGLGAKSAEQAVFDYFGDEWFADSTDTWNETEIDYVMYLFDRAFGEGGLRSAYWITFPVQYTSLLTGLAARLPDGRVEGGYNCWNVRRFFMRLWALQQDHGLNPGGTMMHTMPYYIFVALPWVDAVLDERGSASENSDTNWQEYYPIAGMRAMSCAHNWGVGVSWGRRLTATEPEAMRQERTTFAEYVWLYDSWKNPLLLPGPTQMPDAVQDWGLNGAGLIYHPFWRNPFVTGADKDVLVSLWQLPDRVLIEVYNFDRDHPKDVTLKIDLDALHLMPQLPWQQFVGVRDLYKDEKDAPAVLDVESRTLTIKGLPPHRGRLIGVRRY